MAGKRTATSELNHDNWDQEEKEEEAGTFKKAPEDILKNRVIKVAKRRNPIGTLAATESENKGVFNSFSAFGKPSSELNKSFNFLSNLNKPGEQKLNGLDNAATAISTLPNLERKSDEYYGKLKGLNESVSKWIKQHVDANPFLNLTPIFKDYERYLEEIEKLKPDESENKNNSLPAAAAGEVNLQEKTKQDLGAFVFKPLSTGNEIKITNSQPQETSKIITTSTETSKSIFPSVNKTTEASSGFSFGFPNAQNARSSTTSTSSQAFSFGSSNTQSTPSGSFGIPKSSASFSFTNSTPFTFANLQKSENDNKSNKEQKNEEEESDEPPKNEFKPVVEEGHVYSVRCKVFVKKDQTFVDRGVGNLYLKPVPDSEKTQLIVRADTNLGNVLLNFILSASIPFQRVGKKDVMGVTLPTPDSKPPPIPILLRVKSSEEADNLLKELEKYKK